MIGKQLVVGAAALHLALASVVPVREARAQDQGRGFWDAVACATCLVVGGFAVASGGAEVALTTLLIGGPAAVGLVSAATACVRECVKAFE